MTRRRASLGLVALAGLLPTVDAHAQPEPQTILQYFETSWSEITNRMPEIASRGYTALWLPPPTKGAEGVADVGFSVFDRFDLGEYDQRDTIPTKYGSKDDLVRLVQEAHRFGVRVYFDTVMNHNANPAKIENPLVTLPIARMDEFPGTSPLDYHVLPARDVGGGNWEVQNAAIFGGGTYVMSPNVGENEQIVAVVPIPAGVNVPGFTHLARAPWIDFSNAGPNEEQHLSLLGLIDFAIEQFADANGPTAQDGINVVSGLALPRFLRNADRPDTYPGATPVEEDIREYQMRWVRWFGDVTDCDGLRLDAIKHVPPSFFQSDFTNDPIDFNGAFQTNYDARRGFADSDDDDGAQDALLFGEAFTGDLGALQVYRNTGMLILDFPLLFQMAHDGGVFARWGEGDIGALSFPQGGMSGRYDEFGGLGRNAGISFVQSHDTQAPGAQPNAAYAFALTRVGHSVVFYDGNNFNPQTFVAPGRLDALGELGSSVITELLDARNRFARGGMFNRFVDGDTYVYERVVPTSDGTFGATLLVGLTDNTQSEARFGEFDPRPLIVTELPPGTVLSELTGNGAISEITVLDPALIPAGARDFALAEYDRSSDFGVPNAYGFVYLQIPAGPDNGFVVYAPKTPPVSLSLTSGGVVLPTEDRMTVGPRLTPAGAPIPAQTIRASQIVRGQPLTIRGLSDATAGEGWIQIDRRGQPIAGRAPAAGTPESLYDGLVQMDPSATAEGFELLDIPTAGLEVGIHVVTVKVTSAALGRFYSERTAFLEITEPGPTLDGGVMTDGGVLDADVPDAAATDGGPIDPDPDRDGIPSSIDICPDRSDPDQTDFDGDGVGDACDQCGSSPANAEVDRDGCTAVPAELASLLDRIIDAIVNERFDAELDGNGDGTIDARDFVLRSIEGGIP